MIFRTRKVNEGMENVLLMIWVNPYIRPTKQKPGTEKS